MRFVLPVTGSTRLFSTFILAAWLSGCASGLSKEECDTIDWRTIGYEDGVKGWTQARVGIHRKACGKHGVVLDLDAYRQGWDEGVERYCQPGNGYRQGRIGGQYQGVCPERLEPGFTQAYQNGRDLYVVEKEVQRLNHTLKAKQRHLGELETAIRDTGIDLVAPGVSTEQRVILLDELRKIEAEYSDLRNYEIPEMERQLATQQDRLANLQNQHQY